MRTNTKSKANILAQTQKRPSLMKNTISLLFLDKASKTYLLDNLSNCQGLTIRVTLQEALIRSPTYAELTEEEQVFLNHQLTVQYFAIIVIGNNDGAPGLSRAKVVSPEQRGRCIIIWNDTPNEKDTRPYRDLGFSSFTSWLDFRGFESMLLEMASEQ